MIGRRMLRAILPKRVALRLRQEWIARRVAGGRAHIENEIKLLPQVVSDSSVCWDIGANVGMYTVALSPLARRVIAFEPVPHNLGTLRQAIRLAGLKNVDIHALALSDATGTARFSVPVNQGFYGGYYIAAFHEQGELEVCASTIDALIRDGLPAPDFIKCDVEGAETQVINGARGLLSRARPVWLLETFDASVLPLMESLGYMAHIRTPENALARVSAVRDDCRNYIFLPAS
jgi:FkbM family methyltransferase